VPEGPESVKGFGLSVLQTVGPNPEGWFFKRWLLMGERQSERGPPESQSSSAPETKSSE
jgi:hypothetical protein